jgi:hypothetical protein
MTKEAGDLYAKVMVDTPGLGLLDYAVPVDMLVAVGDRVVVGLRTRNVALKRFVRGRRCWIVRRNSTLWRFFCSG